MQVDQIHVEVVFVGFPRLYGILQGDRVKHAFAGKQISDLIDDLALRYGKEVRESLLTKGTETLDPTIKIMINRDVLKRGDLGQRAIMDGDEITFLRLLAGG